MACFICKDVKTKDVFSCDGCNNCICKGCGGLTASEVKVLQLVSGRTLKFYCPKCIKGDSFDLYKELVTCKEQIIEDKNEIIKLLKKDIEDVIVKDPMSGAKMGYNEVLKSNKKEEVILIKPKNTEQTSILTRRKLEEAVNPCTLGATVSKVKNVRQGGVAIKCSNQEEIKTICENVQKQIGTDYEVKVPEKKNPRIEVFNVGQKLSENKDELIEKW
ncbi:hypothetical protein JTB14_007289 [Gonioctena quinquepunctata]|nr:hypothetical protein JTB14_007289 [Gonioctena quinquepunctata]